MLKSPIICSCLAERVAAIDILHTVNEVNITKNYYFVYNSKLYLGPCIYDGTFSRK